MNNKIYYIRSIRSGKYFVNISPEMYLQRLGSWRKISFGPLKSAQPYESEEKANNMRKFIINQVGLVVDQDGRQFRHKLGDMEINFLRN